MFVPYRRRAGLIGNPERAAHILLQPVTEPHESVATNMGCATYPASPARIRELKLAIGAPGMARTQMYVPRADCPASQKRRPTGAPVGESRS